MGTRSWDGSGDERDRATDRARRPARQRWSGSGESSIYGDSGGGRRRRDDRADTGGEEPEAGRWSSRRNRWVPEPRSGDDVDTTADYTVRRFDDTGELPAQRDRPGRGRILDHDDWPEGPSDRPAWLTEFGDEEPPYDPYWGKPRKARPSYDPYWGTPSSEDPYRGRQALPAGPSRSAKPPPKPPEPRYRRPEPRYAKPEPPQPRYDEPEPRYGEPQPRYQKPEPPPEAPTTALLPRSAPSGPAYGAYRRNQAGQDWRSSTSDRMRPVERRTQALERRPSRGEYFSGGGDFYRASWQDTDDDDDGDVYDPMEPTNYLAAALSTIAWFVVPALAFLGWVLFLDAGPRNEALRNLSNGAPWIGITVAASIVLALVLRRLATGWRALTVGFASAVVGAGAATVLFTVVSQ